MGSVARNKILFILCPRLKKDLAASKADHKENPETEKQFCCTAFAGA